MQERGVDAVGALADHYKVSTGDVYDMISDGEIAGQEAARIILRAMADSFGGAISTIYEPFAAFAVQAFSTKLRFTVLLFPVKFRAILT